MESTYINYLFTKEPSKSKLGEFVRTEQETLRGKSLACLAAADRINHIEEIIEPALHSGKNVISDRCVFSAYVFNMMDNVPFAYTDSIYSGIRKPDAIFLLYASPEVVHIRLSERSDLTRYEKENLGKEQSIIDECESHLSENGLKIYKISTEASIENTAERIIELLFSILEGD